MLRRNGSASEVDDVDTVWQDKLSISRNQYDRGSVVVFRWVTTGDCEVIMDRTTGFSWRRYMPRRAATVLPFVRTYTRHRLMNLQLPV